MFSAGETVIIGEIARVLPGNHSHATQVGLTEFVQLAGLASIVNHSCDPNCGVRVNGAGGPDLVARQDIAPAEEITFDYAMRNYSVEHFPSRCRCGAACCRGSVTGWIDLPEERKLAYRGLVAPYLLELDPRHGPPDRRQMPTARSRYRRLLRVWALTFRSDRTIDSTRAKPHAAAARKHRMARAG
jgi:hypothetical protein